MTRNPADLLLNEHLDYLKLTCVRASAVADGDAFGKIEGIIEGA